MLREHLGHGDKGLDLHHVLFADVVQFCEMTLADVVNGSKVPREKEIKKMNSRIGQRNKGLPTLQGLLSRDLHQDRASL